MCWFLPNINMNQSLVYSCSLPHEHPSHLLLHPAPLGCYWAWFEVPESHSKFPLATYFTYCNIYFHVTLSIHNQMPFWYLAFFSFRFSNELLLFFIFKIVESPRNGPEGLLRSISLSLSQKVFIILASSVSPESSKLPLVPRSLRSTSRPWSTPTPTQWPTGFCSALRPQCFVISPEGASPPTSSTNKTGLVWSLF